MKLVLTIEVTDRSKLMQQLKQAIPEIKWLLARGKDMNESWRPSEGGSRRIQLLDE